MFDVHKDKLKKASRTAPEAPGDLAELAMIKVARLKPYGRNARSHSKKQIQQVAASIRRFGFTSPVIVDEEDNILAGHARVRAAEMLGLKAVPCRRILNLSEVEKRAYILADNKLALNAVWDEDLLAEELQGLLAEDFDLELTGFSVAEVDQVIAEVAPEEPGAPEEEALPEDAPARCRPGDVWQLGPHRLKCGNSLLPEVVRSLMKGRKARMVFADVPYNKRIKGHVGGRGVAKHREFAMASGEMSQEEFEAFLKTAFERLTDASIDGSIHFVCIDWKHIGEVRAAAKGIYTEQKNLIVWVKENAGMGTFYRSRHELIFVFKYGKGPHKNNFELGHHGRHRTNVWNYRGMSGFHSDRLKNLALHPTVKPVEMIADAIRDVSGRGDVVLDLFGGSGSTLIAAHKTGRRAYICEIDPRYCDRIIARWEAYAKDNAVRVFRRKSERSPPIQRIERGEQNDL